MAVRLDIVSIGTLSRNRLWGESQSLRTPHATTTLIRVSSNAPGASDERERRILVDPGLPAPALEARLFERTGLRPAEIDVVFLTNFRPAHRAGLAAFESAEWLLFERERETVGEHLTDLLDRNVEDEDVSRVVKTELELLRKTRPAADKLATQIDLFPLPGFTAGTCGLLVAESASTTLIAGDAVPSRDHLLSGQVLGESFDQEAARESMREVYEIADIIVPGHDNLFLNPRSFGA